MDRQFPPAGGTGPIVRRANGRGDPRLRISALRYPLMEGRRVRNRQFGRKPGGMCRAATLPHGLKTHMENNDGEVCADDSPPSCPRMAGTSPAMTNDGFWRNEP